jgi:hypothetical protein
VRAEKGKMRRQVRQFICFVRHIIAADRRNAGAFAPPLDSSVEAVESVPICELHLLRIR